MAQCRAHVRRKLREVFDHDGTKTAAEGLRRNDGWNLKLAKREKAARAASQGCDI